MSFGLGALFDPLKFLNKGTGLFGGPGAGLGPNAPGGLLRAGAEGPLDIGNAMPLTKAGMEGAPPSVQSSLDLGQPRSVGMSRDMSAAAPPIESSAALHPAETAVGPAALTGRLPESTMPMTGTGAGITTPTQSPQYAPTPPQPGEGAGSLPKGPLAPAAPGPAATPPPAAAGPVPTTQLGQQSALQKLGDMGKALGSAGGAAAGAASSKGPGSTTGAHTPDGSALMQSVMKAREAAVPTVGPVPGLPPGMLQRFKR
jgi:hypothetical protein